MEEEQIHRSAVVEGLGDGAQGRGAGVRAVVGLGLGFVHLLLFDCARVWGELDRNHLRLNDLVRLLLLEYGVLLRLLDLLLLLSFLEDAGSI